MKIETVKNRPCRLQRVVSRVLLVLLPACTAWFAPISHSQSFDCDKAATTVEKTICSDSELSRLDEALEQAYSATLRQHEVGRIRATQLRWLAQRNACRAQPCIRSAYLARLEALEMALPTPAARETGPSDWKPGTYQRFRLVRGRGVEVCEAYLAMLRGTYFERPPYCDRPEPADVPGFTPLERIPLAADSVLSIATADNKFQSGELDPTNYPTTPDSSSVEFARTSESHPQAPVQFASPMDIDNDGTPDQVAYWPDPWNRFHCGSEVGFQKDGSPYYAPRRGVALDAKGRFDVSRTHELFAHPNPRAITIFDDKTRTTKVIEIKSYWPIARMITFTKYRDTYYFDGMMDSFRDLEQERADKQPMRNGRPDYRLSRSEALLYDTIGVYERRNSKTVRQCEIRWVRTD